MSGVAFVDTETLGLDPDHHPVWEVGLILPTGEEIEMQLEVTERELALAAPIALDIGQFHERYGKTESTPLPPDHVAGALHELLTDRVHLAGAVVSFDEERLRRLLWRHGLSPRWHYHLIDVETLAVGYLQGRWQSDGVTTDDWQRVLGPPFNSDELSRAVGVEPDHFARHTALGDARWAKAIYDAVSGTGRNP